MKKELFENLAQPLVNLYTELEKDMLVNMAARLAGKKNLLKEDPETWKLAQLHQLGMLDKDNLNRIKTMLGVTSAELNQLLYDAGTEGLSQQEEDIKKAVKAGAKLRVPPPINESPQILKIMQAYGAQAANVLNLVNQTMLIHAKQKYVDTLNRVALDVISGFKTHDKAVQDAIKQWAEDGIPALIDKGGKKWGVEGYVRTVVISTIGNTTNQMQDTRMKEWGIDLIEISSHSGARPLCAPFQGRIFSVSGSSQKYPPLSSTSYGKPAGLFGINCGHVKYPFIEGVSEQTYKPYPPLKNAKAYKQSQVQRAHERGIRKAKTQYEMFKAAGDQDGMDKATALIKQRQSKLRDFIEETGRTRRRYREQIHTNKKPDPKPTSPFPDPGMPKPKKVTKTIIDTPKPDMQVKQTASPDPVMQQDLPSDYKVKHKDIVWQSADGTIRSRHPVYAVKGKGKDAQETLLGDLTSKAVTKKMKGSNKEYSTTDGYIATLKDGTQGEFKTQKAAKEWMLNKHLSDKGIVQAPKTPMKPTAAPIAEPVKVTKSIGDNVEFNFEGKAFKGQIAGEGSNAHLGEYYNVVITKDSGFKLTKKVPKHVINGEVPVAPEVNAYKPKLMDEVSYKYNGEDLEGKIIDHDKKTGDVQILTPDKKIHNIKAADINGKKGEFVPKKVTVQAPEPAPVLPEPSVIKTTKPKKTIEDVVAGDTVKFYDENGDVLVGEIKKKYTSGKTIIEDTEGALHKVESSNLVEHMPEETETIDYDSFMRIDPDHFDIKETAKVIKKMDPSESKNIRIYTGSSYRKINGYLRGLGYQDDELAKNVARDLKEVISKHAVPLSQNTKFFRNMDSDALPHLLGRSVSEQILLAQRDPSVRDRAKSMVVGGAFQDKAFVSSTYHQGAFGSGMDIAIQILTPKGYRGGIFVESVSEFSSEREYLFNANTKFNIVDVEFNDRGPIIFKVMPE
jgi:hypothetical protein